MYCLIEHGPFVKPVQNSGNLERRTSKLMTSNMTNIINQLANSWSIFKLI